MNYKRLGCLGAICALVVVSGCLPGRGDRVVDTWEATTGTLKVRIRKFNEKNSPFHHNYQVFEAAAGGSDTWRQLLEWRTDGGYPIMYDRVQIVSPQVVNVFFGTKYVVTTDAGQTWTQWDALKLFEFLYPLQVWIMKVHVSPDGNGILALQYRSNTGFTNSELTTTDYGVHWTMK
jgi:hypothetical protein